MKNRYLLITICSLFIGIISCDGSKQVVEQIPEADKPGQEIAQLKADISELQRSNRELNRQNSELAEDLRKYSDQKVEMSKRIESLIAGYGTGIWSTEDAEDIYPVFKKPLKSADVETVIFELNREFSMDHLPRLLFKKKEDNIVFVGVDDEEYLTQRMGSSGALSYMAEVTYSITSVKGVDCVFFEFEEGDHAVPGQYCRYFYEPQRLL